MAKRFFQLDERASMSCCSSAPLDVDWDKYTASVDVLQENQRANTALAQPDCDRPALSAIKTGAQSFHTPPRLSHDVLHSLAMLNTCLNV